MEKNKKILAALLGIAGLIIIAVLMVISIIPKAYFDDFIILVPITIILIPIMMLGLYMGITGKGAMMVAGYNTMSGSQRACYNSRKLAEYTGWAVVIILGVLYLGLVVLVASDNFDMLWILIAVLSAIMIAALIFFNTGGRFLNDPDAKPPEPTSAEKRKQRKIIAICVVIGVAVLAVILMAVSGGDVKATLNDDNLNVDAPMVDETIKYSDIRKLELRNDMDIGNRTNGFGGSDISSGTFKNAEFGNYTLASYNSVGIHIVVHTSDSVLVFNADSADKTVAFYTDLENRITSMADFIYETRWTSHVAFV